MKKIGLFFLLLLVGIGFGQKSMSYKFKQFDAADLGAEKIIDIHWDSNGLPWMLTDKGLILYNGYKTTSIPSGKDKNILSSGIREIHSVSKDEFWLSYDSIPYLTKFSPLDQSAEHYYIEELTNTEFSSHFTTKIFEDSKKQIWIAIYTQGILKFHQDPEKRKFYHLGKPGDDKVYPSHPSDIDELEDGRFLISFFLERDGKRSWPVYFDPNTGEIEEFGIPELLRYEPRNWMHGVVRKTMTILNFTYIDSEGKYWFGTYSGMLYFDPVEKSFKRVSGQYSDVNGNLENARDYLIQGNSMAIATANQGIMMINRRTKKAFYIANDPKDPNSLRDNRVISMSRDPQGNIWVLTRGTGVSIYSPLVQQFRVHAWNEMNLDFTNRSAQTIPVNQMLVNQQGHIFLSHGNGIVDYDANTGDYRDLDLNIPDRTDIRRGVMDIKFMGDSLVGLLNDHFMIYTDSQSKEQYHNLKSRPNPNHIVFRHSAYRDQIILCNTANRRNKLRFWEYDPRNGKIDTLFTVNSKVPFSNSSAFSEYLPSGNWLISERYGRFLIVDPNQKSLKLYSPSSEEYFFPDSTVRCAFVHEGEIWLGTSKGVYTFNESTGKYRFLNDSIGLDQIAVNAMIFDQNGDLWIAMKDKVMRWKPDQKAVEIFDKYYGLNVGEFLSSVAQIDAKGNLYFATRRGVLRFHPDRIRVPNQRPKLHIGDFFVNEVKQDLRLFSSLEEEGLQLSWDQSNLIFDFYTDQVYNLKPNTFYYRLNSSGDWIDNGINNRLRFRELKYGTYKLEVKVVNGYGVESEVFTYEFKIARPFWLSWWFYLILIILAGVGVYYYIRFRERALKRKSLILEEKVEERTQEVVKQKQEADHQRLIVEEKQREITDSIKYAQRIQSAIMPSNELIKEKVPDSFILYKPKDIVAGDFYWMEVSKIEEQEQEGKGPVALDSKLNTVLIAAADCTGHGVPGAMVSVVCNNSLNRSVREFGLTDPGKILDKTRELVIQEFEKSTEDVKDGMDIALVSLEQEQEGEDSVAQNSCSKLKYAGAHNPLWIIRKGAQEIEEIKASKQPIGKYHDPQPFETHEVSLQKGDTFYIFSDGFADQFGGEKGKKFKTANLKKLFLSIREKSMEEQKEIMDQTFEEWKGDHEQLDDVCVIGVKL